MSRWPMVRLGEVISSVSKTEHFSKPYEETFITIKMHGRGIVARNIGDGKTPKPFRGFRVTAGQFIYSRIDARNGAFGVIPLHLDGAVVSKDFPVYEIDSEKILPSVLVTICTSDAFVNQICSLSDGATNRQRIKEAVLENLKIPLPPLTEQKRIAEILGGVAESVKATENEIGKLEQLSFSVVNSFITREVTETQPLHELVTFRGGSTPSKKNVDFWSDGEIRWFSSKDLKADELVDSLDHITTTALKDTALKPVSENKTIAISLRGMSLAHRVPMSIIPGHSCVNQDLKALAPADGVDIRVLFALLKQQEPFLLTKVATSAHGTKKLDFPHLRDLEVPALSLQNISTLKIQLDELAKWRSCLDQKLALLQELQRSLSARAFDGRL